MRGKTNFTVVLFILVASLSLPCSDILHAVFASETHGGSAPVGDVISGRSSRHPMAARVLTLDDCSVEIHATADHGGLVIANRFVPGGPVRLSGVTFYGVGAASGDRAGILLYEDPTGTATVPDPAMAVFSTEVPLEGDGFQTVEMGGLVLNRDGHPDAAFFVALAFLTPMGFALGIDVNGPGNDASFISEDGGRGFVSLSTFPIIGGNAMIRAIVDGGADFTFWADVYTGYGNDDYTKLLLHGDGDGGTLCFDDSYLDGYIDELRISKGVARWTSAFTPPVESYE